MQGGGYKTRRREVAGKWSKWWLTLVAQAQGGLTLDGGELAEFRLNDFPTRVKGLPVDHSWAGESCS
jgi:hypothetical protein